MLNKPVNVDYVTCLLFLTIEGRVNGELKLLRNRSKNGQKGRRYTTGKEIHLLFNID